MNFESFKKIPRIERINNRVVITEKLDGTNAQVAFCPDTGKMWCGSRNRWLQPEGVGPKGCDNYAFAAWCHANETELRKLGPGRHYGEWYGVGVGRGYGLFERRFALFNVGRWGREGVELPACVELVTVLFEGESERPRALLEVWTQHLRDVGSKHVPGFMKPEGAVAYFPGYDQLFKALCEPERKRPSPIEHADATT